MEQASTTLTREQYHSDFFLLVMWDFWYCGHYWPIVPAPDDSDGDCGKIGGMKIGRGNRSTLSKPAPALLSY
jgi:hypothetical protein